MLPSHWRLNWLGSTVLRSFSAQQYTSFWRERPRWLIWSPTLHTLLSWFFLPTVSILLQSEVLRVGWTSLSAPTNFVLLSLLVVFGLPLRAINPIDALRQLSVSNLDTTSICTALIVKQVNRQHHHFSLLRPFLTVNGPELVNSNICKGCCSSCLPAHRVDLPLLLLSFVLCLFYKKRTCFWLILKRVLCLGSTSSTEACFLHAQWRHVDCPCAHFARIIQQHDFSNVAKLDALHWSPIDFCLFFVWLK